MFDLDKAFVLRLKGETKGHIFYEYLERSTMFFNESYIVTGKMKNAWVFDTESEAVEEKQSVDKDDDFDIVAYRQAEDDYYNRVG